MGFLPEAGAIEIGKSLGGGHLYHFSQYRNRLYVVFVNPQSRGEVWESRNEGLTWIQIDDIGRCNDIAVRGRFVNARIDNGTPSPRLLQYDVVTGNTLYLGGVYDTNGPIKWGGTPIPIPESESSAISSIVQSELFGAQRYFHDTFAHSSFGRVPGRRTFALWGYEHDQPFNALNWSVNLVWNYVDPFFEVISFAAWAVFQYAGVNSRYITKTVRRSNGTVDSGPFAHTFENDIHGSGYEGFLNGRQGWEGVGKQEGNPSPSFFQPADHWQGNLNNSAPLWIPSMVSDFVNLKIPISSTPSGLTNDSGFSRGAVMGFVGGEKTFGMVEPGFGFGHCQASGYFRSDTPSNSDFGPGGGPPVTLTAKYKGVFKNRKFIGNLGVGFLRSRIWMPYSSGIFGMGMFASLAGDPSNVQSVIWIYDKQPKKYPTSVLVEDGKYTDRDDKVASQAQRGDGAYYRW